MIAHFWMVPEWANPKFPLIAELDNGQKAEYTFSISNANKEAGKQQGEFYLEYSGIRTFSYLGSSRRFQ
jgi:hypothetical protein